MLSQSFRESSIIFQPRTKSFHNEDCAWQPAANARDENCLNPNYCRLKVDGNRHILVTEFDVEEIFGLRVSGPNVFLTGEPSQLDSLAAICDLRCGPPKVATYWEFVNLVSTKRRFQEDVHPLRPPHVCAHHKPICYVKHLRATVNVESTGTYNWVKFVLHWLWEEVKKNKNNQTYWGWCVLLLVVSTIQFYYSLATGLRLANTWTVQIVMRVRVFGSSQRGGVRCTRINYSDGCIVLRACSGENCSM